MANICEKCGTLITDKWKECCDSDSNENIYYCEKCFKEIILEQ